jgi:hypothetical protein
MPAGMSRHGLALALGGLGRGKRRRGEGGDEGKGGETGRHGKTSRSVTMALV